MMLPWIMKILLIYRVTHKSWSLEIALLLPIENVFIGFAWFQESFNVIIKNCLLTLFLSFFKVALNFLQIIIISLHLSVKGFQDEFGKYQNITSSGSRKN